MKKLLVVLGVLSLLLGACGKQDTYGGIVKNVKQVDTAEVGRSHYRVFDHGRYVERVDRKGDMQAVFIRDVDIYRQMEQSAQSNVKSVLTDMKPDYQN